MKSLIKYWPREIAFPERLRPVIRDTSMFFKKVNQYNGIKNVYFSLYNCDEYLSYDKTILDKMVFDFDHGNKSLQKLKEIIPKIRKKGYKHAITFSGNKGFHLYIFLQISPPNANKYHVLYNAHKTFMDEVGLTEEDVDPKLIGDIKRIIRCPNTMHLKSRLYCISLSAKEIEDVGYRTIRKFAEQPRMKFFLQGDKLFSTDKLDYTPKRAEFENMPEYKYEVDIDVDDELIKKAVSRMLPCVQTWLTEPKNYCLNISRWYFAVYCRDIGLPPNLVDSIAKKFWGKTLDSSGLRTKYQEFTQEKQMYYANKKQDFLFPSCDSLYKCKLCKGKCSKYKRKGSPLYK